MGLFGFSFNLSFNLIKITQKLIRKISPFKSDLIFTFLKKSYK